MPHRIISGFTHPAGWIKFRAVKNLTAIACLVATLAVPATVIADETPAPERRVVAEMQSILSESYFDRARELVMTAVGHIGVRYRFGGNTPDQGFDCSGLVRHVFSQVAGLILPRSSFDQANVGTSVNKSELQPGDLVFFNTRRAANSHVGIYIGDQRMVHAPSSGGKVEIVDMTAAYWAKRFTGARRVTP